MKSSHLRQGQVQVHLIQTAVCHRRAVAKIKRRGKEARRGKTTRRHNHPKSNLGVGQERDMTGNTMIGEIGKGHLLMIVEIEDIVVIYELN